MRPLGIALPALAAALIQTASPAAAQSSASTAAARAAQVAVPRQDVMRTVNALFDAMRAADSAGVRATFDSGATLMSVLVRDGHTVVRSDSVDQFVRAIGTPHQDKYDERIANVRVLIDGPLSMVWADYTFYRGSTKSHCGVDAFLLARRGTAWRILSVTDTRRVNGCPSR